MPIFDTVIQAKTYIIYDIYELLQCYFSDFYRKTCTRAAERPENHDDGEDNHGTGSILYRIVILDKSGPPQIGATPVRAGPGMHGAR